MSLTADEYPDPPLLRRKRTETSEDDETPPGKRSRQDGSSEENVEIIDRVSTNHSDATLQTVTALFRFWTRAKAWSHLNQIDRNKCAACPTHCCFETLASPSHLEMLLRLIDDVTTQLCSPVVGSTDELLLDVTEVFLDSNVAAVKIHMIKSLHKKSPAKLRTLLASSPAATKSMCEFVASNFIKAMTRAQRSEAEQLSSIFETIAPHSLMQSGCEMFYALGASELWTDLEKRNSQETTVVANMTDDDHIFSNQCAFVEPMRTSTLAYFSTWVRRLPGQLIEYGMKQPTSASERLALVSILSDLACAGWQSAEHVLLCEEVFAYCCTCFQGTSVLEGQDGSVLSAIRQRLVYCLDKHVLSFAHARHTATLNGILGFVDTGINATEAASTQVTTAAKVEDVRLEQSLLQFGERVYDLARHVFVKIPAIRRTLATPGRQMTPHVFGPAQQAMLGGCEAIATGFGPVMCMVESKSMLSWARFPEGLPSPRGVFQYRNQQLNQKVDTTTGDKQQDVQATQDTIKCPWQESQVGFLGLLAWDMTVAAMNTQHVCSLIKGTLAQTLSGASGSRCFAAIDAAIEWVRAMMEDLSVGIHHRFVFQMMDRNDLLRGKFENEYTRNFFLGLYRQQPGYFIALFTSLIQVARLLHFIEDDVRRNESVAEAMTTRAETWQTQVLTPFAWLINALFRLPMPHPANLFFPSHHRWWSSTLSTGTRQHSFDHDMPAYGDGARPTVSFKVPRDSEIMYLLETLNGQNFQQAPPSVSYMGEQGIGEGVLREFITGCSKGLFAPEFLDAWQFQSASNTFGPCPVAEGAAPNFVYDIAGWVMALAIKQRVKIPMTTHPLFLVPCVRKASDRAHDPLSLVAWTLDRLRSYDVEFAATLSSLQLLSDDELLKQDLSFDADEIDGTTLERRTFSLWSDIPRETVVTRDNLDIYIAGRVRFALWGGGRELAWHAIMNGFSQIIPMAQLDKIDFDLMPDTSLVEYVCGDVECMPDLSRFMRVVTYGEVARDQNHRVVQWFWELVKKWDDATRRKLLKFWTSSHFVDIYAVGRDRQITIDLLPVYRDDRDNPHAHDQLMPTAASCFRALKIPQCSSQDILERQMLEAITHHNEGMGVV